MRGKKQHTDNASNGIRIRVRSRTTILKVTVALGGALAGDTNGRTTVGHAVGEGVDGAGLVTTRETLLVAFAVDCFFSPVSFRSSSHFSFGEGKPTSNMLLMPSLQLLDRRLDILHAALLPHLGRRKIAV